MSYVAPNDEITQKLKCWAIDLRRVASSFQLPLLEHPLQRTLWYHRYALRGRNFQSVWRQLGPHDRL